MTVRAAVAIGSNLGSRRACLESAIACLDATPGVEVLRVSALHETAPVGGPSQGAFLNGALLLETDLDPEALLSRLHEIEREHGRERPDQVRNGPRTLDLDLLLVGGVTVSSAILELPHPRMHERLFVLAPLVEIAPELRHTVRDRTISELHQDCLDQTSDSTDP
jgi:2-amino-4-hydroxy-6-hydroxymethyldihydropteridine diphosphokinase